MRPIFQPTLNPYLTDPERWQAVLDRDVAADSHFVYAVKTTGIYCRPTCPSRRPNRQNVAFYPGAQQAESAGYRACQRCCPEGVSLQQQRVAQVQHLLETPGPEPSLNDLAEALGLSPAHVQRTFRRATGLSPKQYAVARRGTRLKEGLLEGKQVTTALYDAGYGSSQTLYGSASLGMTAKTYQQGGAGERIGYSLFDSALGRTLVAATMKGVVALWFGEEESLLGELRREYPAANLVHDSKGLEHVEERVARYLHGDSAALRLSLDQEATAFQQRVWQAVQEIPYGETRSYGEVAQMIGQPTATRAVARALATNPVALVVPCHRVIKADGGLSGYRWGSERKSMILERERRSAQGDS